MKNWIHMKKEEIKCKLAFYTCINQILKEKENLLRLTAALYESLKDSSGEELQDKLISAIAQLAHDASQKGHGLKGGANDR